MPGSQKNARLFLQNIGLFFFSKGGAAIYLEKRAPRPLVPWDTARNTRLQAQLSEPELPALGAEAAQADGGKGGDQKEVTTLSESN